MVCHGQLLAIAGNEALFSLLGTTFGGDGRVTFSLPDLRKKKADGSYYLQGENLPDGTPYIESYICIEGIYPSRNYKKPHQLDGVFLIYKFMNGFL